MYWLQLESCSVALLRREHGRRKPLARWVERENRDDAAADNEISNGVLHEYVIFEHNFFCFSTDGSDFNTFFFLFSFRADGQLSPSSAVKSRSMGSHLMRTLLAASESKTPDCHVVNVDHWLQRPLLGWSTEFPHATRAAWECEIPATISPQRNNHRLCSKKRISGRQACYKPFNWPIICFSW